MSSIELTLPAATSTSCARDASPKTPSQSPAPSPSPTSRNYKRADYINWDDYFMATALLSAKRSKDPDTQVGACIVDSQNRIVAIGYNGMPRNCDDNVFPWGKSKDDSLEDKNLYVVHAEANAILNKNTSDISSARMYTTLFPCNECAKLIIQAGLREVFFISDEKSQKRRYRAAKRMFEMSGVRYQRFTPTQNRIVLDFEPIPKQYA